MLFRLVPGYGQQNLSQPALTSVADLTAQGQRDNALLGTAAVGEMLPPDFEPPRQVERDAFFLALDH